MDNNTKQVKIQVAKPKKIENDQIVKVIVQGDRYADVLYLDRPARATVRKLDKKRYCVLSTGEIKEYEEKEEKDKRNLKKTFAKLRQLIRTNFESDCSNQLFITLTYAENMTDMKRLRVDFDKFIKRLKYRLKGHNLDYIVVMEPQGRGAWHAHLMLKSDKPILYIDNKELEAIWGFGYTDTQRLKSDDVGSYYVAYFTDILQETGSGKKRVKGGRLQMYPKNFKFYRTSKGIKQPEEVYTEYEQLAANGYERTHQAAFELIDEEGNTVNTIQKETWKRRKEMSQKSIYTYGYPKDPIFDNQEYSEEYDEMGVEDHVKALEGEISQLQRDLVSVVDTIKKIDSCVSSLHENIDVIRQCM